MKTEFEFIELFEQYHDGKMNKDELFDFVKKYNTDPEFRKDYLAYLYLTEYLQEKKDDESPPSIPESKDASNIDTLLAIRSDGKLEYSGNDPFLIQLVVEMNSFSKPDLDFLSKKEKVFDPRSVQKELIIISPINDQIVNSHELTIIFNLPDDDPEYESGWFISINGIGEKTITREVSQKTLHIELKPGKYYICLWLPDKTLLMVRTVFIVSL